VAAAPEAAVHARPFATLLAFALMLSACASPRVRPQGVLAPDEPLQEMLPPGQPAIAFAGHDAVPIARFRATARVLSAKHYAIGRESKLAPVDLALGWGRMSDSAVLEAFSISQSARAFRWSAPELPIREDEILTHAANMHMIPASADVRATLMSVRAGDVVEFSGALVEVFGRDDEWSWASSTSRNDVGDGACELVVVRELRVR
jgi:hypothetical protein